MYNLKEYSGFHESYYEHNCPIIPERDVLYTDIIGTGFMTGFKRCWHDLFLLSSINEHSRGFYNSSHAMRIERFRQYRKYRSRIHPMSKFTNFWNSLILFAFIANKILFRFTSSIIFDNIPIYIYYFGAFIEVMIIIDLLINLKTGYVDEQIKKVVLDSNKSLINYCSKKLFLHIISAIPMHWLMFLRYGLNVNCGLCKSNRFICAVKIMSVFGLYRVFEMSAYWTNKRFSSTKMDTLKFVRIGTVGLVSMLLFYDMVDVVWILKMLYERTVDSSSFVSMLIFIRYGMIINAPNYMVLCFDLSRIFKSLLLFSFGVKYSSYALDKMSSVIAYVIANSFYAWTLLECYSLISRIYYPKDKLRNVKYFVLNLLRSRQLSDELMSKVDQYFDFAPTRLRILELGNGLYKSVPSVLRKEITLSCFSTIIMRIPLFSDWPLPMIEDLTLMLKQEVFLRNDIVAEAWSQGRGLMIVDVGVLAVYSIYHVETGHLIDGDYFGQISLVTNKEVRMSYVVAVSACKMLIIDKSSFRTYMRQHPDLFYELKMKLQSQFKAPEHKRGSAQAPDRIQSKEYLQTSRTIF